jgi:hypothetical protein
VINQIRGFLIERGITVRQGVAPLRKALPDILSSQTGALSPRMVSLIVDLVQDWRRLDERIAAVSAEIEALAQHDDSCQRLMTVPGIGPIISSAVVAAIGNGAGFQQGRDFGAWLGLVPRQESTGDRTILGKISKRGNKYLRTLFVQAAHVVLERRPRAAMRGLWPWIEQASKRLHRNMLAIALANKLARIAWAVLARGRAYQPKVAANGPSGRSSNDVESDTCLVETGEAMVASCRTATAAPAAAHGYCLLQSGLPPDAWSIAICRCVRHCGVYGSSLQKFRRMHRTLRGGCSGKGIHAIQCR